jgi:hypothetical protein
MTAYLSMRQMMVFLKHCRSQRIFLCHVLPISCISKNLLSVILRILSLILLPYDIEHGLSLSNSDFVFEL